MPADKKTLRADLAAKLKELGAAKADLAKVEEHGPALRRHEEAMAKYGKDKNAATERDMAARLTDLEKSRLHRKPLEELIKRLEREVEELSRLQREDPPGP